MFWSKKTIESAEFLKLFKMIEEQRIRVESLSESIIILRQRIVRTRDKKLAEMEEKAENNGSGGVILPVGVY